MPGMKSPWMSMDRASQYSLFPQPIEPEAGIQETGFLGDPLSGFVNEKAAIERRKGNIVSPWLGVVAAALDPDVPYGFAGKAAMKDVAIIKGIKDAEKMAAKSAEKKFLRDAAEYEKTNKILDNLVSHETDVGRINKILDRAPSTQSPMGMKLSLRDKIFGEQVAMRRLKANYRDAQEYKHVDDIIKRAPAENAMHAQRDVAWQINKAIEKAKGAK